MIQGKEYIYIGDNMAKFYESEYIGKRCFGVLRDNGKCIVGKKGTMLVMFGNELANVLRRQLRKVDVVPGDSMPGKRKVNKGKKVKLKWKQLSLF